MSSPIAKPQKTKLDNVIIEAHKAASHSKRIEILAHRFADIIKELRDQNEIGTPKILDIGCGDMTLAERVADIIGCCEITCTDIHPCPKELQTSDPRWLKYVQFDGKTLPFADSSFDIIILSDVLHHVPERIRPTLLSSAARVAKFVVIKDHFEYSRYSRQMLRAMDWIGNYGYGISIPDRYFNPSSLGSLLDQSSLSLKEVRTGLQLYEHIPLVRILLRQNWHFFAICKNSQ